MFAAMVTYRKMFGEISFNDGILSEDSMLMDILMGEAEDRRGQAVVDYNYSPLSGSHIKDPLSIRLLIEEIFDNVTFYGYIPKDVELEEGDKG